MSIDPNANPNSVSQPQPDFEQLEAETEISPPEAYASNLIEWAIERRASDLFISDQENSVLISVRRMGKVEPVRRLARGYGHRLQGHLRVAANADAGEVIRPVDGRGLITTPCGTSVDIRLSAIPTLYGQDVAIRLFDPVRGARSLDNLGYADEELAMLRGLINRNSGLILVAGPVASGKSSTLYSAIEELNDGSRKIHTLEDPIEHSLSGVMQSQVNLRAGLDFADLLSAVLRHSPDVIMIGEIRDARTASTAVRAGASGQLVLATIHAKNAAEAVDAMLQYETNPKFLAGALIGVINQRLLRRLCPECQVEGPEVHQDLGERIGRKLDGRTPRLYSAGGCDACFGDGFSSLTCIPEIMVVDQAISDAIATSMSAPDLESLAVNRGMLCLAEVAAARVLNGITTPQEANQAVADPLLATLAGLK